MQRNYSITVSVEEKGFSNGHDVLLNGAKAYHRPYDGSISSDVFEEFCTALGQVVREKLGHPAGEQDG